jgi:hypothetical protein
MARLAAVEDGRAVAVAAGRTGGGGAARRWWSALSARGRKGVKAGGVLVAVALVALVAVGAGGAGGAGGRASGASVKEALLTASPEQCVMGRSYAGADAGGGFTCAGWTQEQCAGLTGCLWAANATANADECQLKAECACYEFPFVGCGSANLTADVCQAYAGCAWNEAEEACGADPNCLTQPPTPATDYNNGTNGTVGPSAAPSAAPTAWPTTAPTAAPTAPTTKVPTSRPSTGSPTFKPTSSPTKVMLSSPPSSSTPTKKPAAPGWGRRF